jgi:hypothetical protein
VEILVDPSLVAGHYVGEPYIIATLHRGGVDKIIGL